MPSDEDYKTFGSDFDCKINENLPDNQISCNRRQQKKAAHSEKCTACRGLRRAYFLSGLAMVSRIEVSAMMFLIL